MWGKCVFVDFLSNKIKEKSHNEVDYYLICGFKQLIRSVSISGVLMVNIQLKESCKIFILL